MTRFRAYASRVKQCQDFFSFTGGDGEVRQADVDLVAITQRHRSTGDIVLEEKAKLRGIGAIGGARPRDKKRGPLDEVIDRLNELFADEGVRTTREQQEAWLHALVAPLLANTMLRGQAHENSLEQFLASPILERSALTAVYSNAEAFEKMNEILQRGEDPQRRIIDEIGRLVYMRFNGLTSALEKAQQGVDEDSAAGADLADSPRPRIDHGQVQPPASTRIESPRGIDATK